MVLVFCKNESKHTSRSNKVPYLRSPSSVGFYIFYSHIVYYLSLSYVKTLSPLSSLLLVFFVSQGAVAQHNKELNPGYYVVVSAYAPSRENVAQNYVELLNRRGFQANYGFNSSRHYFFVYLT